MIDLKNRTALVTGASRGIGAATARRLAGYGASVVLAARSGDEIERGAADIRDAGGAAVAVVCDVSCYGDVDAAVQLAVAQFGGLDILVNNAGLIEPIARLAESDPAEWGRIADINYKGVYHGLRAALPAMVAQGGGVIVNVSSGAGSRALEGWSHYCSSKAAVSSLTRCADAEYRDHGIRVVGLTPGTVATDMQAAIRQSGVNPVSRIDPAAHSPPEWAGEAIAWLCTEAGAAYAGTDFAFGNDEARALVGVI
jgi:3-oxoacyl-[acyl-carrier protein] reductase